jgi:hypothetical protein
MVPILVFYHRRRQHWLYRDRRLTAFAGEPVGGGSLGRQGDSGQSGQGELHGEVCAVWLMVETGLRRRLMVVIEECGV